MGTMVSEDLGTANLVLGSGRSLQHDCRRTYGPIHLQNFLSLAGAVPYCRDTPYTGFVQEDQGAWDELCLKCKKKLPKGIACKPRLSGGVG